MRKAFEGQESAWSRCGGGQTDRVLIVEKGVQTEKGKTTSCPGGHRGKGRIGTRQKVMERAESGRKGCTKLSN